jgi:hypothetical protein
MRSRYVILLLVFVLMGCQFTPSPTQKTVTTNDVLGKWSFPADYGKTTVIMAFQSSGIFTQMVLLGNGQTNSYQGQWSLDGAWLRLVGIAEEFGGTWNTNTMSWYFIDGRKKLELFGGESPDPDSWQSINYLGTEK